MDRKRSIRLISTLYDWLLWLYPPRFREKFAGEQRQVFSDALEAGDASAGRLFLRELAHLPGVLLRCHWAAFRGGGWRNGLKGLAITILFLMPILFVMDQFGTRLENWVGAALLVLFVAAVLAGALLGFPRWALPYAGFLMPWLLLQFTNDMMNWIGRHMPRRDYSQLPIFPRLGVTMMWDAARLAPILVILFAALILLRLLPVLLPPGRVTRLLERWQRDRRWSDLAFLLYGTVLSFAIIIFDEYRHNQWYLLAASILFLAGAAGFLIARSQRRSQRQAVTVLLCATTLAFITISVGKWMIVPLQTWDGWLDRHPVETERWFEALSAIGTLVWMLILLLIPAGWRPFIESPEEKE